MASSKVLIGSGVVLAVLLWGCKKESVPAPAPAQTEAVGQEILGMVAEMETKAQTVEAGLDQLGARLDSLEVAESTLAEAMTNYYGAPERAKTRILEDVDKRAVDLSATQDSFQTVLAKNLDDADASMVGYLRTESDRLHASLETQDIFFRYFFTQQDSVNGEIANRFDKKPWYTSIISGWSKPR